MNATVVGEFDDGAPAAVMSEFGKGRTLLLGSYVSASAQSTPTPEAERFFAGLLTWAGVSRPVRVANATLEVRTTESGRVRLLFVFNHTSTPQAGEITIETRGNVTAMDLATGRQTATMRKGTAVSIRTALDPGKVAVFRLTPR